MRILRTLRVAAYSGVIRGCRSTCIWRPSTLPIFPMYQPSISLLRPISREEECAHEIAFLDPRRSHMRWRHHCPMLRMRAFRPRSERRYPRRILCRYDPLIPPIVPEEIVYEDAIVRDGFGLGGVEPGVTKDLSFEPLPESITNVDETVVAQRQAHPCQAALRALAATQPRGNKGTRHVRERERVAAKQRDGDRHPRATAVRHSVPGLACCSMGPSVWQRSQLTSGCVNVRARG